MNEIAALKSKKLPELQEIAKTIGLKRITGLKKLELIDKIIDELPKDTVIIEVSIFDNQDEIDNLDKRILKIKGSSQWLSLFKNTVEQALQT